MTPQPRLPVAPRPLAISSNPISPSNGRMQMSGQGTSKIGNNLAGSPRHEYRQNDPYQQQTSNIGMNSNINGGSSSMNGGVTGTSYPGYPSMGMGGSYGSGMYGYNPMYGGMGMNMGMGMGMGGYGMGMGGPFMGILSGPLSLIYTINYFIGSLGQVMDMLGMNSHAIMHLYQTTYSRYVQIVEQVRTSETRRWLQRKCKKSQLFRLLLVVASCAVIGSAVKVIHYYLDFRRRRMITAGVPASQYSQHQPFSLSALLGAATADHAPSASSQL